MTARSHTSVMRSETQTGEGGDNRNVCAFDVMYVRDYRITLVFDMSCAKCGFK